MQILESGDLLISNVRESDAGLYTCTRANEAGAVTGGAYLGVMGKKIEFHAVALNQKKKIYEKKITNIDSANANYSTAGRYQSFAWLNRFAAMQGLKRSIRSVQHRLVSRVASDANHQ